MDGKQVGRERKILEAISCKLICRDINTRAGDKEVEDIVRWESQAEWEQMKID